MLITRTSECLVTVEAARQKSCDSYSRTVVYELGIAYNTVTQSHFDEAAQRIATQVNADITTDEMAVRMCVGGSTTCLQHGYKISIQQKILVNVECQCPKFCYGSEKMHAARSTDWTRHAPQS